ncbi:hypothetical protein P152DRAFT_483496 [Eremomyces bilateralis CBS 781.70]|uniref:MYND-type domain-containing protein n=1 Tax=Eremomyces bilateralis CBS 781.70 TaxID=1392243 RepID=A0A6G1FYC5_9PEZI|nr:uncharacterized protein P152DRAFT_483496 [Eremomyces bilateralis CBS 781.70]KAF1810768.1 hypothetical protein P152DRAFT_483496 [Eremomyces bilateralis CBS 781.70]
MSSLPGESAECAPLEPECVLCGSTTDLSLCSGCRILHYCGSEHQAIHWPAHKSGCKAIKAFRTSYERIKSDLPNALEKDGFDWHGNNKELTNIFDTYKGKFWKIQSTRPYMRARFTLVEQFLQVKTYPAVGAALGHLEGMLQLCRGDNLGVRDYMPSLYLRLGRDQDCYDFVKWWQTTGQSSTYDWGNMDNPYLDVKGADAFEEADYFDTHFGVGISNAAAVTLLKIRLLQSLRALDHATASAGGKAPPTANEEVRKLVTSSIVTGNPEMMASGDHSVQIIKLERQVQGLIQNIAKMNEFFWPAMLSPREALASVPEMYAPGSKAHANLTVQQSYNSWAETPGAIDMLREYLK